jgi:flagellar hook-associated protein 3 FlgL
VTSVNATPISYTPSVIASQLINNLNADQSLQASLEQQLSSGNIVNSPSDDPAAAASIMQLNSSVSRAQQYSANAADGQGWLSLGNSTVNQVLSTLQSVQQAVLSVSGQSLSGNPSTLASISSQVSSARTQLINLANTTYGGQAIFAGTGNPTQAYDQNGTYVGGGSAPTRTVAPNTSVQVGLTGQQVFGDGTNSPDLLGPNGLLSTIASDLASGNVQGAQSNLTNLQSAITNVEDQAAVLGTNYQQMQSFSQQATNAQAALQTQLSSEDSVNVAQTTTQLVQAQQSFQSALWATSQIQRQSLVNYLS